jgi:uncharacterized ParB-like nuclease family protein
VTIVCQCDQCDGIGLLDRDDTPPADWLRVSVDGGEFHFCSWGCAAAFALARQEAEQQAAAESNEQLERMREAIAALVPWAKPKEARQGSQEKGEDQ